MTKLQLKKSSLLPFFYFEEQIELVHLFIAPLSISSYLLREAYTPTNSEDRELSSLTEKQQIIWLTERLFIRYYLSNNSSLHHTSDGSPFLSHSSEHLSISHTKTHLAIAFAPYPIGIDLEEKKRNSTVLLQRIMHVEERELFKSLCPHLSIWTSKEAVFKLFSKKGIHTITEVILRPSPSCSLPGIASWNKEEAILYHIEMEEHWLTLALPLSSSSASKTLAENLNL